MGLRVCGSETSPDPPGEDESRHPLWGFQIRDLGAHSKRFATPLSHDPGQRPPADNMEVNVRHFLTAFAPVVYYHAVSLFKCRQTFTLGYLVGHEDQVGCQVLVLSPELRH